MRTAPTFRTSLVVVSMAGSLLLQPACSHAVRGPAFTAGPATITADAEDRPIGRLPTGNVLDPAYPSMPLGPLPLAGVLSPHGNRMALLLSGWRRQGIEIVDPETLQITQTIQQKAAFLGLAFSPDSRWLYASGGNEDLVYRYAWNGTRASLHDTFVLAAKKRGRPGTRYPAGLSLSPDGHRLYVAENLGDSLAVFDTETGILLGRYATERYPYAVLVADDGTVYVSAWGGDTVSILRFDADGQATENSRVTAGRHPSAMVLNPNGSRLYIASGSTDRVAVLDTGSREIVAQIADPPPAGPAEGSTPNHLAVSADGTRLYVAEADNNAVAVFELSATSRGTATGPSADRLLGRVPVDWYPTVVTLAGDWLLVASGKGAGTRPNPARVQPGRSGPQHSPDYTLGQLSGSLTRVPLGALQGPTLEALDDRVAVANGWKGRTRQEPRYPPFEHVVYVIKENRTYDQVFGDVPQGDGDPSLVFFPRDNTPNHHALAERFGLYDRFFVNAEVSPDGHNWSMAAYTSDYLQKTVPSNYSGRGRSYDYEGSNRGTVPDEGEDVNEPALGYLWDRAEQAGISFRNFGEFVVPEDADPDSDMPHGYRGKKPFLEAHTSPGFPGFDLDIPDQVRLRIWLQELAGWERDGNMPALQIVRLPSDHTAGGRPGSPTPQAMVADNDLALGRLVAALSRTRFWESTVVFVLEDDAQAGPDHVDSHRSLLLVISPYNRPGTVHRWINTTDVVATITEILGIGSLSQFDYYGRPLRSGWGSEPDLTPYDALTPGVPLDQINPPRGPAAQASLLLDLDFEDSGQDDLFNRILWRVIKGDQVPYPGIRRIPALEYKRGR